MPKFRTTLEVEEMENATRALGNNREARSGLVWERSLAVLSYAELLWEGGGLAVECPHSIKIEVADVNLT